MRGGIAILYNVHRLNEGRISSEFDAFENKTKHHFPKKNTIQRDYPKHKRCSEVRKVSVCMAKVSVTLLYGKFAQMHIQTIYNESVDAARVV